MSKSNPKKKLFSILFFLSIVAIAISYLYYDAENNKVDPRIVEARELYKKYDSYAEKNNFTDVLLLLDSIESIFLNVPHYQNSYEVGVVHNNRAAVYLTIALFADTMQQKEVPIQIDTLSFDSLLNLAEYHANIAIEYYVLWKEEFALLSDDELKKQIQTDFFIGLEEYSDKEQKAFLKKRLSEVKDAQVEIDRRISVALTNLGIVFRHREDYETAADCYLEAIELWDKNLQAENNLNVLLNQPQKERSVIEKLLPDEK
jgi:tetratricopeptide (TPR) repeat protein